MDRAFACLEVKAVDETARIIEGIATTPTADRMGDVVDPQGATFALPLPLLWHHDPQQPIGQVIAATVTPAGIQIRAQLTEVREPGSLRDRLETAWQSIKAIPPLVRGLSIGFKPLAATPRKGGGLYISKWLWGELSAVTIPANVEATIARIKSLAAIGHTPPGATGSHLLERGKVAHLMTIQEQISGLEASRAAKAARMGELLTKAAETGSTFDAAQTDEYDGLTREVEGHDAHLVRLRAFEKTQIAAATVIAPVTEIKAASDLRGAMPVITVKPNLAPATGFIRYVQALSVTKGSKLEAVEYAKRWADSTPEVELCLKAAVAAGTTTDATWAGPLAQLRPLANEFVELLRPQTYLGRIPGLKKVPFNVSVPQQTGGGTYQWVGQGAPKPVGKLTFGTITLSITKCAGIIVITEELARESSPSAEGVIRDDMIRGIAQFLDAEFIDPAKAAVANVSPGSITNGVTPITTAGTSPANARTDIQALINAMTAAGISVAGAVLIMSETNAAALAGALNPLGQDLFPALSATGGTALGLTVLTSQTAGNNVVLLQPSAVLYADDGGVTIDVSREASVQMDSAPDNPALATTVLTSFWQNNLVGLRAERFINWKRARTGAVQYTVATYTV